MFDRLPQALRDILAYSNLNVHIENPRMHANEAKRRVFQAELKATIFDYPDHPMLKDPVYEPSFARRASRETSEGADRVLRTDGEGAPEPIPLDPDDYEEGWN